MNIFRLSISLAILAVVTSIGILFFVKSKVQQLNKSLISINKQITQESEEIHILQAELAHLSRLSRLEQLANKHLVLGVIKPEHITNEQQLFNKSQD